MYRALLVALAATQLLYAVQAHAFCGFYVGKADATLFNQASQVILVRDGGRTAISMLSDYHGSLDQFALVVPVPQVLNEGQIHIGSRKLFDHIDAYSAPRLAEYYDDDPCRTAQRELRAYDLAAKGPGIARTSRPAMSCATPGAAGPMPAPKRSSTSRAWPSARRKRPRPSLCSLAGTSAKCAAAWTSNRWRSGSGGRGFGSEWVKT
jgi:hypothetical protein